MRIKEPAMQQSSQHNAKLDGSVSGPAVLLLDNGSLRPQAVFALRQLAENLSKTLNQDVLPVSVTRLIQTKTSVSLSFIGAMAKEALIGQDGLNVDVVIQPFG